MNLSPAFHELRSAYQAEMDDLSFDSEGRDVLRQRLKEKRGALDFLLQMTELSPEMVAVVFHQGFRFNEPAVMQQVVSLELDDCPDWDEIAGSVQLQPWAQELAEVFLQQADGQRFMTVAAALSFLYAQPGGKASAASREDGEGDEDTDEDGDDGEGTRHADHGDQEDDPTDDWDDEDEAEARARDEAGADWLADQGFDRKD